jgi:hypothetical protein
MLYCVNCIHFDSTNVLCNHRQNMAGPDPVYGLFKPRLSPLDLRMTSGPNVCGPDGIWFTAITPP